MSEDNYEDDGSAERPAGKISRIKARLVGFVHKVGQLQGDPHYVAMGMAIGFFVGVTPTIPFHTAIAIFLAFVLRGSKPAAAIGVWFANPVTIPVFYIGSYKVGVFVFGGDVSGRPGVGALLDTLDGPFALAQKYDVIADFLSHHFEVACMMLAGGVLLGIIPAILSYFITYRFVARTVAGVRVHGRGQKTETEEKDLDK